MSDVTATRRAVPGISRLLAGVIALVALIAMTAGTASADDKLDRARTHYQRGVELFNQSKYKAAIAEFAAADGIAPSPILEYNMALCYDRLGEQGEALRRYKLYLKRVPAAKNRAVVEQKIARLEKAMADASRPAPDPEPYETLPDGDGDGDGDGDRAGADPTPEPDPEPDATPPAASTGDPELDRVSRIDVASIRDERGLGGAGAAPVTGDDGDQSGAPPPAPMGDPGNKPTPIYKKWWFWVVVGVSAIILIDIAASGNDNDTAARVFDPSLDQRFGGMSRSGGGLTIRF